MRMSYDQETKLSGRRNDGQDATLRDRDAPGHFGANSDEQLDYDGFNNEAVRYSGGRRAHAVGDLSADPASLLSTPPLTHLAKGEEKLKIAERQRKTEDVRAVMAFKSQDTAAVQILTQHGQTTSQAQNHTSSETAVVAQKFQGVAALPYGVIPGITQGGCNTFRSHVTLMTSAKAIDPNPREKRDEQTLGKQLSVAQIPENLNTARQSGPVDMICKDVDSVMI